MSHSPFRPLGQTRALRMSLAALVASTLTVSAVCAALANSSEPSVIGTKPAVSPSTTLAKDNPATAPPGLVLIPGGRTVIGSDVKDIEKLLTDNLVERRRAGAYISETPQFKREVPDFYLMVTEVTNEQFAAYIRSTGNRPPEKWGKAAIEAAAVIFLREAGEARAAAEKAGKPLPPREKFDGQAWWAKNWKGATWAIPTGEELKPVVYVDYQDAENYASWAGLRLMSEFEFQRAVRGNSDDLYPWGSDWKKDCAVTADLAGKSETAVVGKFECGATKEGVYDLVGNAWEWTSSPFVEFPKYKSQDFKLGKGKDKEIISATANWDADKRVCVGGCYHSNKFEARATTRRGASRTQTADAQTFRCAASLMPGVDIADRVMAEELDVSSRPKNPDGATQYAGPDTLAVDRWTSTTPSPETSPAPGYSIITGYDYVIFTPVDKVYSVDVNDLTKRILDNGPEPLGFLSTNQRILKPDLEPGTYMISYRCPGKRRTDNTPKVKEPAEGEEAPAIDPWNLGDYEKRLGLDEAEDYYLFFNKRAEIVGFVEAHGFDKKAGKLESAGSASFFNKDYVREDKDENGKKVKIDVHEQWLRFDANIRARAARRGFLATIAVQVENELDPKSFRVTTEK